MNKKLGASLKKENQKAKVKNQNYNSKCKNISFLMFAISFYILVFEF
jgi:hypothetical protein